jgi:hypothetical protein
MIPRGRPDPKYGENLLVTREICKESQLPPQEPLSTAFESTMLTFYRFKCSSSGCPVDGTSKMLTIVEGVPIKR